MPEKALLSVIAIHPSMNSADEIASCPCDFSSWASAVVFLSAGPDLSQASALQPDCLT